MLTQRSMSRLSELVCRFRNPESSRQQRVLFAIRMIECTITSALKSRPSEAEIKEATECFDALRRIDPTIGLELWMYWNRRNLVQRAAQKGEGYHKLVLKRLKQIRFDQIQELRMFSAG